MLDQWVWTVTQNGITKTYVGKNPVIRLAYQGNAEIEMSVTANNGCKSSLIKTVIIDEVIPEIDFNYVQIGCAVDGKVKLQFNNISQTLNPFAVIESSNWVIGNQSFSGSSFILEVPFNTSEITVTLDNKFVGSCNLNLTKTFVLKPLVSLFSTSETVCTGLTVSFSNESIGSDRYVWNFNYPMSDPAFNSIEKNPVFTFPSSGIYTVSLHAIRETDGCIDSTIRQIALFENNIVPDFSYSLSGCEEGSDTISLTLNDLSLVNEPGYEINNWTWTIIQNGISSFYNGKSPTIQLSKFFNAEVSLVVKASNGCTSTFNKILNINDLIPQSDFNFDLVGCPQSGVAEIRLTNISGSINPFATVTSSVWTVGNQTLTGNPVIITTPINVSNLHITLETGFLGTCKVFTSKEISASNLLPNADFGYTPVECPDDNHVTLTFNYIDTLSKNILADIIVWSAGTLHNPQHFTGSSFDITLPKDSILYLDMITYFSNGCTDTIKSSFLPGPFATISFLSDPVILCPNQQKTFVANPNPDWTYTWSPTTGLDLTDPSNPKVSVTVNTTYNVTVSDGLCSVESKVDIVALEGGVVLNIEGDTTSCDGNVSLHVTGGMGQGTYSWSTDPFISNVIASGENVDVHFVGDSQTFYVQFAGESCSTNPAAITVTNQLPKIEDVSPFAICKGDTTKVLTLNLVPGHLNSFVWDNDSHIISGANTATPTIAIGHTETQSFHLFYNVTNQYGCVLRDSILFTISENPVVDFDFELSECGKYEICFDEIGNYNGFIKWNFGDSLTTTDISIDKSPCYLYPDYGVFNVRLENLVGVCPFKDVIKNVVVNPQVRLEPIPDMILCVGDSLKLSASSNLADIVYTWYDMDGNVISHGPSYHSVINADKQFVMNATDIYGCSDSDTINAKIFIFDFTIDLDDSLCINQANNITLNIINPQAYQFLWTPSEYIISGGSTNTPLVNAVEGVTFNVLVTHLETGCMENKTITPKVSEPFDFDISAPEIFCLDQPSEIILNINDPEQYTFSWSPAELFQSGVNTANPKVILTSDRTLTVLVTNKISGCKQEKSIDATAGEDVNVSVDAEPDFTIFEGESLDIFVSDIILGASYIWSTGETTTSITVSPKETTGYVVTVTDENGCTATDEVVVTLRLAKCDETDVYIPNAFTPNNDSNNDILYVRSNFIDELELIIYNRWGQELFRTNDKNTGWDGSYNGKELPPDAYAYYLRVLCINGEEYKKQGNVTLLR
ncbi:MAG: gliding motility-associated C-terminal domain-containing protein [Saprospiraceae bacterium]|nr:gliding motility-associated C-terminal domain-containing protein [Saprospiraceae bacterium]